MICGNRLGAPQHPEWDLSYKISEWGVAPQSMALPKEPCVISHLYAGVQYKHLQDTDLTWVSLANWPFASGYVCKNNEMPVCFGDELTFHALMTR